MTDKVAAEGLIASPASRKEDGNEQAWKDLAAAGGLPESQVAADFWRCKSCGCLWRDNHDGTVSLDSMKQTSCAACEKLTTEPTCEPLFRLAAEGQLENTPWTIDGSMPLPVCLNDTIRRADVVTVWNEWRCGLPADKPFRHSDGVAFLNKLNDILRAEVSSPASQKDEEDEEDDLTRVHRQ